VGGIALAGMYMPGLRALTDGMAGKLRGTTIAVYLCIGFAGGFVGTLLFSLPLDWLGETARLAAWVTAFSICAMGCLVGSIATIFLSRDLGRERVGRHAEK
jgi:hypothetical protein